MTNTANNTCNKQSATEIDLSDFNRSYIVGNAFCKDGSHGILMFDLHTTENESEYPFMVVPKFSLVEPISKSTIDVNGIRKGFDDGSLYSFGTPRCLLGLNITDRGEEYLFRRIRDDQFTSFELTHIIFLTPDEHYAADAFASADFMMHSRWGDNDVTPRIAIGSADVFASLIAKFNTGFISIPDSTVAKNRAFKRFMKGIAWAVGFESGLESSTTFPE